MALQKHIAEQEAKIERLNVYSNDMLMLLSPKNARAEAITAFAERLKKCLYEKPSVYTQQRYIVNSLIDQIAKETRHTERGGEEG